MIKSLKLKDFKCFSEFEVNELEQINLFTGSNGRGKSTIFQALLLLSQSSRGGKNIEFLRLNGKYLHLGIFEDVVRKDAANQEFEISIRTDDSDENEVSLACVPNENNHRQADIKHFNVKYSDGRNIDLYTQLGGATNITKASSYGISTTAAVAATRQLINVNFVSADRVGPTLYALQVDDRESNPVGIHGEYSINTLQEKGPDFVKELTSALSMVMGGASISVDEVNADYLRLLIDSQDAKVGFRPINVGFGYSYILPILIATLSADKNSKLFIENPEAHLHPGAQSRLMQFIIKVAVDKNLQVFIETHSDHIINALRIACKNKQDGFGCEKACIVHVGRCNETSLPRAWQIKIDREGNLSEYPDDFMAEWGKQMLNLV